MVHNNAAVHVVESGREHCSIQTVPNSCFRSADHLLDSTYSEFQPALINAFRLFVHVCRRERVLYKLLYRPFVLVMGLCGPVSFAISEVYTSAQSVGVPASNSIYVIAFISFGREVTLHDGFFINSYKLLH